MYTLYVLILEGGEQMKLRSHLVLQKRRDYFLIVGPTAPLRFPCLKLCTYLTHSPERLWANEFKLKCERDRMKPGMKPRQPQLVQTSVNL